MSTISMWPSSDQSDPQEQDLHLDENGNLAIARGKEDVRQRVLHRMYFWLGQWAFDTSRGVDYLGSIFVKGISNGLATSILVNHEKGVDGVAAVLEASSRREIENRKLYFTSRGLTNDGPIDVEL